MILFPCDIFVTRGTSWLARGIRWATHERGEEPTAVNHVGAIVEVGPLHSVCCIEALEKVECHPLAMKYRGTGHTVAIYRPTNIPTDDQAKILQYLHANVGRSYGYGKILRHGLRKLTGWNFWLNRQDDAHPICSYLVAKAWSQAGYHFGCEPNAATPDDIHDFCRKNADRYEPVLPLSEIP